MRNAPISIVMSVRPRVSISATPARQISVKFDIGDFYKKNMSRKTSFKSGKNTGHVTSRSIGTSYRCKHHLHRHSSALFSERVRLLGNRGGIPITRKRRNVTSYGRCLSVFIFIFRPVFTSPDRTCLLNSNGLYLCLRDG